MEQSSSSPSFPSSFSDMESPSCRQRVLCSNQHSNPAEEDIVETYQLIENAISYRLQLCKVLDAHIVSSLKREEHDMTTDVVRIGLLSGLIVGVILFGAVWISIVYLSGLVRFLIAAACVLGLCKFMQLHILAWKRSVKISLDRDMAVYLNDLYAEFNNESGKLLRALRYLLSPAESSDMAAMFSIPPEEKRYIQECIQRGAVLTQSAQNVMQALGRGEALAYDAVSAAIEAVQAQLDCLRGLKKFFKKATV